MSEVKVDIPYQERHRRLSVLLRPILMIPILLVMLMIIVPNYSMSPLRLSGMISGTEPMIDIASDRDYHDVTSIVVANSQGVVDAMDRVSAEPLALTSAHSYLTLLAVYVLAVPLVGFSFWFMYVVNIAVAFTLMFRKKYPDWWFNWNQALQSFVLRIYCYSLFLTDRYPTLESVESQIKLSLPNPKEQELNRFLPFVKWLLVVPYMLVYLALLMVALVLVPVSFLVILITGRLPRWIHNFQVAVISFYMNIAAYALLLVTDKYPRMIFRR